MPHGRAADLVVSEVAVIAYAVFSWRMAPIRNGNAFTYSRKSGYGALVGALLLAIAVETIPVQVLLSQWSGAAACIASGLAVYGGIWLVGDLRAIVSPGAQRLSIQLASHVDAVGFYGLRRRVRSFELGVDDPAGLRAILESHRHRQG
jgi:hypothetical protein